MQPIEYKNHPTLNIFYHHSGRARSDGSKDVAILLDVQNRGTIGANFRAGICRGISISEGHGAEIAEWNKTVTLCVVLNNPLGVLLAKCVG